MSLIAVIPGDGIGPEVIASALTILKQVAALGSLEFAYSYVELGGASIDRYGEALTEKNLDICLGADAVLLGAVGGPRWESLPGHQRPESGLLRLREKLGVYANIRPVKSRETLVSATPYRAEVLKDVDLVMVRELTGGIYFGEKGRKRDQAFDVCSYQKHEIIRVTRTAAEIARSRRGRLCSIDKANVMETSRLWREVVSELVRDEFPDLHLEHVLVDAAAMYLAQRPASFDVLVTENMFGDILSDLSSTLAGSLGLLPSASLGGEKRGLYEPIHGSAPDIAGRGIANPIGAILSVAMMLRCSFGEDLLAVKIESAVEHVLREGPLTPDLKTEQTCTTEELTQRIARAIDELKKEEKEPLGKPSERNCDIRLLSQ